jgi:hypothetical protein
LPYLCRRVAPTIKLTAGRRQDFFGRISTKNPDKQRAGFCQTVWENSQDSKIHYFSG